MEEAIFNCNALIFNTDWHSCSSTLSTLPDSLETCSLVPITFAPTHHTEESYSTIDYICVSDVSVVTSFKQVQIPSISKHDVLFVTLSITAPQYNTVRRRSYRNFNLDKSLCDRLQIDWRIFYFTSDVDAKVKFFTCTSTRAYDAHAPLCVFTPRKNPSP